MSPEISRNTPSRQPYPMTPELKKAANKTHAIVVASARKLDDVLAANVPDEMVDEFTRYASQGLVNEEGTPNAGNGQSLTGYRFISTLLGHDSLDDHGPVAEEATFEHVMFVGAQKITAANTIRKLLAGEISADSVRESIQTFVDNIPAPETQLPPAYRGMVFLSAILPYLLVSRTDIKPTEIGQYAGSLDSAMKATVKKDSVKNAPLIAGIFQDIQNGDGLEGALTAGKNLREKMLGLASYARANSFIVSYYTAPAASCIADTIGNLRRVERDKREMTAELAFMMDLAARLDVMPTPQFDSTPPERLSLISFDDLPVHMRVDWEVLPPGAGLTDVAHAIIEEKQLRSKQPVGIDLTRLQALENIRSLVSENSSRYARGSLRERGIVRDGDQECPDEYILLLIDGSDGNVESVVADSPIVGPHAMYIYRRDTAQKGSEWQTVFRLEKADARRLGARAVKHSVPVGDNLVDTMTRKAMELLTCRPEDFARIQFNGVNRARIKQIGRLLIGGENER